MASSAKRTRAGVLRLEAYEAARRGWGRHPDHMAGVAAAFGNWREVDPPGVKGNGMATEIEERAAVAQGWRWWAVVPHGEIAERATLLPPGWSPLGGGRELGADDAGLPRDSRWDGLLPKPVSTFPAPLHASNWAADEALARMVRWAVGQGCEIQIRGFHVTLRLGDETAAEAAGLSVEEAMTRAVASLAPATAGRREGR